MVEKICTSSVRKKKRISRRRLAIAVGVTPYQIQKIDWGQQAEPFLAERIARALGVDVEQLRVD